MKKRQLVFFICAIVIILFLFFPTNFSSLISKFDSFEKKSEDFLSSVIPENITNPGPLRFFGNSISSHLTEDGVLYFTNKEREKVGISSLTFDKKLNIAAANKIADMFNQQYFAHISPDGTSASDLAESARYDYIVIGENLALGNFKDDEELVQAWMDSPGHRANILTRRYQDIGIAVEFGEFEGKKVWLAVQTFGLPASACGSLDSSLKDTIDESRKKLAILESALKAKKEEIDRTEPKKGREYNLKLEEYNLLVSDYNTLLKSIKALVSTYNIAVEKYNACAKGV